MAPVSFIKMDETRLRSIEAGTRCTAVGWGVTHANETSIIIDRMPVLNGPSLQEDFQLADKISVSTGQLLYS